MLRSISALVERRPRTRSAIVIHYHLFKNAGTSIDRMLARAFGRRWQAREFFERRIGPDEMCSYFEADSSLLAVSSHNATLPALGPAGSTVLPIVFLRHPMDRLRSVYEHHRASSADRPDPRRARNGTIHEYFEWLLEHPLHRGGSNFQVSRLAEGSPGTAPELERATRTLAELPLVGIVEDFDRSIDRFAALAAPHFPGVRFRVHRENVRAAAGRLDERLDAFRARLGDDLYGRLERANMDDLLLWHDACRRSGVRIHTA